MEPSYHISEAVAKKLKEKHGVSEIEVVQCFRNRQGKYAYDTRPEHQTGTETPTLWFIAETAAGRKLKVIFLRYTKADYVIKSAYPPNDSEEKLYQSYKDRE
jgi:hypothetical protein